MWKKRDEADVMSNFGPAALTGVLVLVIIILFASWMSNIERKMQVDQVARKYMLKMESKGGLTIDDENNLKTELSQYCDNIVITNQTTRKVNGPSDAKYGDDLHLYITADMKIYRLTILGDDERHQGKFMEMDGNDVTSDGVLKEPEATMAITIHKTSTSKH